MSAKEQLIDEQKSESATGSIHNDGEMKERVEKDRKREEQQEQDWLSAGALWGSSWLKSAKEKTFTTFELVKKDLSELGDVVANEASAIASSTVESVKHQAQSLQQIVSPVEEEAVLPGEVDGQRAEIVEKDQTPTTETESETGGGISAFSFGWAPKLPHMSTLSSNSWVKSFVDTVKSIAQEDTTADEDQHTEAVPPKPLSDSEKLLRRNHLPHCILYEIQTSKKTFVAEPDGDAELYAFWANEFKLGEYDEEINALLKNCPPMRALYQELVPSVLDNQTFWKRYFYKVYQTEMVQLCKKDSDLLSVGTETTESNQSTPSDKSRTSDNSKNTSERSDKSADETWSVCSSTNIEIQEIQDDSDGGPRTPKAAHSRGASPEPNEKSAEGWVDWDE